MSKFSLCHCFSSSQSAYYFLNGQIQHIQAQGHSVSLAVPDDGFIPQLKTMFPHVEIFVIPIVRKISPFQDLKALIAYIRLFKKQQFTIIHLHTPKAGMLGAIAGKILRHKRVIFHLHGLVSLRLNIPQKGLTFFMEKIPLRLANKIICVSESLKKLCIDNNLASPQKITTLNNGSINGIDAKNRFNPNLLETEVVTLKNKLNLNDKFVVGFLGRMSEDKGIDDIINVANRLEKTIPNLLIVLVGPNEMPVDISEYFNEHLHAPFQYHARTDTPELFISTFDVMLFPSYREGFGLVAAEANALKVPVVAYKIAGIQDAISNDNTGILVEPGNINALADAVAFYHQLPQTRKQHGLNGRQRVLSHYDPASIWGSQLDFYKRLLND